MNYEIKTIDDILNCVTEDNVDDFVADFESFLKSAIVMKGLNDTISDIVGVSEQDRKPEIKFVWTDDGKGESRIHIGVKK